MSLPPRKQYGFRVFVGSCIFTTITIVDGNGGGPFAASRRTQRDRDAHTWIGVIVAALVLWDERQQRERRQEGVKYRLKSIQQQQNMQEYEEQRQRYEDYKKAHSL